MSPLRRLSAKPHPKKTIPSSSGRRVAANAGLSLWVAFLTATFWESGAEAQRSDVKPLAPNVLLLVDNSGSMSWKTMDRSTAPRCSAIVDRASSDANINKWGMMLQVMTGSFQPYWRCEKVTRTPLGGMPMASWANPIGEASLADYFSSPGDTTSFPPPDFNRSDEAYYRPISGNPAVDGECRVKPGVLPSPALSDYPLGGAGASIYSECRNATQVRSDKNDFGAGFPQINDGLLDVYKDLLRFGFMSMDGDIDPGIGDDSLSRPATGVDPFAPSPFAGSWSYFRNWNTGDRTYALRSLSKGCDAETGARNPSAPPWEGRLIPFDPMSTTTLNEQQFAIANNERIQRTLLATRTYAKTPLKELVYDAKYFLTEDKQVGPSGKDPYRNGARVCRKQSVVLLTDGHEVETYSDSAEQGTAVSEPDAIIGALRDAGITTHVVGFGHSCPATTDPDKSDCEWLQRMADAGVAAKPGKLYTPIDELQLRSVFNEILSAELGETTRSLPTYSPTESTNTPRVFSTSFNPADRWKGKVTRKALGCGEAFLAQGTTEEALEVPKTTAARRLLTALPEIRDMGDTARDITGEFRPYCTSCTKRVLSTQTDLSDVTTADLAKALIANTGLCVSSSGRLPEAACASSALDWALLTNVTQYGVGDPVRQKDAASPRLGPIYHATPAMAWPRFGHPRDPSYDEFVVENDLFYPRDSASSSQGQQSKAAAHSVLYVPTNDGMLHAFDADSEALDRELWAMLIPGALPDLVLGRNGGRHLLDGSPVLGQVPWARMPGTGQPSDWHTMLVGGFGPKGGFYALDVSKPLERSSGASVTKGGPQFRWHLTGTLQDANKTALFGPGAGNGAITTVNYFDGQVLQQVGVAILPGGSAQPLDVPGTCPRYGKALAAAAGNRLPVGYPMRPSVRHWSPKPGATATQCQHAVTGRSLYVVRLDNGEILRAFGRSTPEYSDVPTLDSVTVINQKSRITHADFDSPITGTPTPFPNAVGAIAEAAYVLDADGTLWRLDLSSSKPEEWKVEPLVDLYALPQKAPASPITAMPSTSIWAPTVALDAKGDVVLLAASGANEDLEQQRLTYVASLTERYTLLAGAQTPSPRASVNWYKPLPGLQVSGPMTIFGGAALFAAHKAPAPGVDACDSGEPRLFARSFTEPLAPKELQRGGAMKDIFGNETVDELGVPPESTRDGEAKRGVIAGVNIGRVRACTAKPVEYIDPVSREKYQLSPMTEAGSFRVTALQGDAPSAPSASGVTLRSFQLSSISKPTVVDSWAVIAD